jgi:hypothetical protein
MRRLILFCLALVLTGPLAGQQRTRSPHGDLKLECKTCHRAEGWTPVKISKTFDHGKFGFPLQGAHTTATCRACHKALTFKGAKQDCTECHKDVHLGELGANCARCHSPRSFQDREVMIKAHQATRFPLTGLHLTTDCTQCHASGGQGRMQFVARPTECVSCHEANYLGAKNPDHVAGGMSRECSSCHSTAGWNMSGVSGNFNHDATAFPLTGAHKTVACASCHGNNYSANLPTACSSCHQKDYDATTNPKHTAPAFSTTCTVCHTTTAWIGAPFDHNTTQFPLTGAHKPLACTQCHGDGVYAGKPITCVSCHQQNYDATTSPKHSSAGFSTNCVLCHTTTVFTGVVFNHDVNTTFPLTGAHKPLTCDQCHGDGVYAGKATTCVSCHQNDATNATTSHAGFPTTCTTCHTTTAWTPSSFNHNTGTTFPLTGAHTTVTCAQCHGDGVYAGKPTTCVSCHQLDYNNTTNPKHSSAGFSTNCVLCHTTTVFTGVVFNHNTNTTFPLTGAHTTVTCQQCHGDGVYAGKPTTCVSCHASDASTATLSHTGFPTTCTTCHTTTAWTPSSFNHNTNTTFPLTGAHTTGTCVQCHGDGVYAGKAKTCVSCHGAGGIDNQYSTTADPPHAAAGFTADCSGCHTTTAFTTTSWNHNTSTSFALTGLHIGVDCMKCHADGVYNGKPMTCVPCHQADFTGAVSPVNHVQLGYSTVCTQCHTMNGTWAATGKFDHNTTSFPLTGAHVAVTCASCHGDGVYNGKPTTCVSCHGAGKISDSYTTTTDPPHARALFTADCSTCHNTTAFTTTTWSHTTSTSFPLTGAHVAVDCMKCHADNVYNGKAMTCQSCHLPDYQAAVPNHVALAWPQTCTTCHSGTTNTTAWNSGVTLPNQYHTMFSSTHQGAKSVCTQCHNNANDYSISFCNDHHHRATCTYLNQGTC